MNVGILLHTYSQCKVIDVPIVEHLILRCHLNDIVNSTIYHNYHTRCSGCIQYNWNQNYSHISHGAHCWDAGAIMWRNHRNWSLHIIQINSQQYKHASTSLRNINSVRSSNIGNKWAIFTGSFSEASQQKWSKIHKIKVVDK